MAQRISQKGIDLIKSFEGLELEAYKDIAGVWTIGYGHTGLDVKSGMIISVKEAENLLRTDLESRERAISDLVSVSLNSNEFDALVSFIYNVGSEAFRKSTARTRLNAGDRIGAAEALTWWNKATVNGELKEVLGLTRRRLAEKALFLEPVDKTEQLECDDECVVQEPGRSAEVPSSLEEHSIVAPEGAPKEKRKGCFLFRKHK